MQENIIRKLLKDEPAYRYRQVLKEIYSGLAEDWDTITSLPLALRKKLKENISLEIKGQIKTPSNTNCEKSIIELSDRMLIETVLLRHNDGRNTVCVSSQAGCVLDCLFCSTAAAGFKRNLSWDEIVLQVLFFLRFLKKINKRVNNVVFMGMGEPLTNYKNVLEAVRVLNDKDYFNIGQRKISISTSGVPDKIRKLTDEGLQLNLALSLNAPNDKIRKTIMPGAAKYRLEDIIDSAEYYFKRTGRRIMFEYVLLKNINDKEEHAYELAEKIKRIDGFVNIIPFNGKGTYARPEKVAIKRFKSLLIKKNINVTQRHEFGADIEAACGQLVFNRQNQQNQ